MSENTKINIDPDKKILSLFAKLSGGDDKITEDDLKKWFLDNRFNMDFREVIQNLDISI